MAKCPDKPKNGAAIGNDKAWKFNRRNAGEPVGAAGHVAPLNGEQQHDQSNAERGQRKVMLLELENRHRNDDGQKSRAGDRQGKGRQKGESEPRRQDARDVAADAEECRLRQRYGAGMAEHELKAEHQQRVDAANREDAQIVGAGKKQRVADQRRGAQNEWKPYVRWKARDATPAASLSCSDPAPDKLAEDALRAEEEDEEKRNV